MSSMGDVFHTFPALSDAQKAIPDLQVDWVVEEGFAEIPKWHPVVDKVFSIRLRKWRKSVWKASTRQEIKVFFEQVSQTKYDLVLDAQGLLKSVWVARKIHAPVVGMDWRSAREPLASLFYKNKYPVEKSQHAIKRLRQLFAQALGYDLADQAAITYGLNTASWPPYEDLQPSSYLVFLHGTTWETKYWPESHWIELLAKANQAGLNVVLPWGDQEEEQRAQRIAQTAQNHQAWVPEKPLSLNEVARILKYAKAVVSVDTGLSHVAAALEVPMVVLYRVTDPKLVGADGEKVSQLSSPCAPLYLKKFASCEQEEESLAGLAVASVWVAIEKGMI